MQRRVFDTLKFRFKREIRVRDDEIERLKEKLDMFKNRGVMHAPRLDYSRLQELRQQVFERQTEIKMAKTDMAIEHEKRIQELENNHRAQMRQIQARADGESERMRQASGTDKAVGDFVSSVKRMIKKMPEGKAIEYDPVVAAAKDLEAAAYRDEADRNIDRLTVLRNLVEKIKAQPMDCSVDANSEVEPDDISSVCTVDETLEEMMRDFVRNVDIMKDKHASEMAQLRRRAEILRRQVRKRKKELRCARKQGSMTESELSSSIKTQRRILATKQRRFDRENETLQILIVKNDAEKETYAEELRAENSRLKKEVARLDFAVYGRTGKYHKWRNPQNYSSPVY